MYSIAEDEGYWDEYQAAKRERDEARAERDELRAVALAAWHQLNSAGLNREQFAALNRLHAAASK